ncbi:DUF5776 domain-containing protein [Levilactobacillus acidifarinae]|nr:DUF5776 domain-containing protein [Levilactobacillus acidifarinae]
MSEASNSNSLSGHNGDSGNTGNSGNGDSGTTGTTGGNTGTTTDTTSNDSTGTLVSGSSADTISTGKSKMIGKSVTAIKKIGLYKSATFSKKSRIVWYKKMPRGRQPQFVVIGTAHSKGGRLRYKVRDVNRNSKTYGLVGYITARKAYVQETYYESQARAKTKYTLKTKIKSGDFVLKKGKLTTKTITVINPKGINAYKTTKQTGKVTHYRQGQQLTVKRVVHYNLTTRFQLTNGKYITANKQWVKTGLVKMPKHVTVKQGANLYKDANLQKKAGHHYKAKTTLKVIGWDFSNNGTLRYRVAGGYITGNSVYVRRS